MGIKNGGKGDFQWMKFGYVIDNEVKIIIDKGIKFSDIFEIVDQFIKGFKVVKIVVSKKVEYLKVKFGMEKVVVFLELC